MIHSDALPPVPETYQLITGRNPLAAGRRHRKSEEGTQGREIFMRCVNSASHKNGDIHPSLRISTEKDTWVCDPCGLGGRSIQLIKHAGLARDNLGAFAWLRQRGWGPLNGRQVMKAYGKIPVPGDCVAVYPYRDENGNTLYEVLRYEPKGFSQRRPDGNGGYINNLGGVRRVPYRLPELCETIARDTIVVTEGEKDADRAASLGLSSTTSAGGTGFRWTDDFIKPFKGAVRIRVVCDSDEAGRKAARQKAKLLATICDDVRLIDLFSERNDGSDLSNFFDEGNSLDQFKKLCRQANCVEPDYEDTIEVAPQQPMWEDAHPWPLLDPQALHGIASDVVRLLEPHTEADPVALLLTFVVAFGNAAGPRPHAVVGAAQHPARLFAVLVGETARGRKGQSWHDVCSVMGRADLEWLEASRVSGLGSGEGLIAKLRDTDENAHLPYKTAFVTESEFARLLAIFYRQGNTASAVIRDSWDSGRLQVQTRRDPLIANNAHVSIIAHITADEIRKCLTETEVANGLVNRFLVACERRSKRLPSGGNLDFTNVIRVGGRVREALDFARTSEVMRRTSEAESMWADIYNTLPDEPGILGALTARAEAQMLRLSVAYALLDQSRSIDVAHVQAARALWEYCAASALHVFGQRFGDTIADRLLSELRTAYPSGLDGTQQRDLFGRHASQTRLDDVRADLERRGLVKTVKVEQTGGRPKIITTAVPKCIKQRDKSAKSDQSKPSGQVLSLSSLMSPRSTQQQAAPNGAAGSVGEREVCEF